jgi:hypothetical protein
MKFWGKSRNFCAVLKIPFSDELTQGSEFMKKVYKLVCKGFTKPHKQPLQTTTSQVNPAPCTLHSSV